MRHCPACHRVVMLEYTDPESGLTIDSCPECYGLWFDGEELKRFLRSKEFAKKLLEGDSGPAETVREAGEVRNCPHCPKGKLWSSQMGSLTLDYCLKCRGVWFDRGELQKVIQLYESGEPGNLLIVNQLAEGLRPEKRRAQTVQAVISLLSDI